MSTPLTAAVVGATGLVGKYLLPDLLTSPRFSRVSELGRRVMTPAPTDPEGKLTQQAVDFDALDEESLKNESHDVVFISLGTTKKIAGSEEAFTRIDRNYVVNIAKALRNPNKYQRLVYVSSTMANTSSYLFYFRSKGFTEQELADIGYDDLIILRPAKFIDPDRSGTNRAGETLPWIQKLAGSFVQSIQVSEVVQAMEIAGEVGSLALPSDAKATSLVTESSHRYTVVENDGMIALVKAGKTNLTPSPDTK